MIKRERKHDYFDFIFQFSDKYAHFPHMYDPNLQINK